MNISVVNKKSINSDFGSCVEFLKEMMDDEAMSP